MRTIGRAVAVAAMAVAATLVSGVAVAGKPSGGGGGGGGSTGGGKIWYRSNGQYFTMNSDGSGKTVATGVPRTRTHGGHAWSIRWNQVSGTYPDGGPRYEAFAIRDDGVSVQLTDQPDLTVDGGSVAEVWGANPWTPDGRHVAFVAKRSLPGGGFEGGLYVVNLAFDASGGIAGLVAQPTAPALARPIISDSSVGAFNDPDITRFSWAPDGVQFVYDDQRGGVRVGSLMGTDRALVTGHGAEWSPDGSTIAYVDGVLSRGGYRTVRPDGTGDKLVYRQTDAAAYTGPLRWSPTASHIAFTLTSNFAPDGENSVWRITASGGSATKLTSGTVRGVTGMSANLVEWVP